MGFSNYPLPPEHQFATHTVPFQGSAFLGMIKTHYREMGNLWLD